MALRTSAENAEDVAAGFTMFRGPVPEISSEVTSLIADLYAISSSLSILDDLGKDYRRQLNLARIQPDLSMVQASLKYTLEDIVNFFGRLSGPAVVPDTYKHTWLSLSRFFWDESRFTLATRLAKYNAMLRELSEMAKDKHYSSPLLDGLRNGMNTLLSIQDSRLASQLGRMSMGGRHPSSSSAETPSPVGDRKRHPNRRQRSFDRHRPSPASPTSPTSPSSGNFSDFPPSVPDVPTSPPTSTTNTTATNDTGRSTASDTIKYHWAKEVYGTCDTQTPLPPVAETSDCRGESHPGVKQAIREKGFEELLRLSVNDDSDMSVSFYLREKDHRARILCKVPRRGSKPSEYFCLPLNLLEILRERSCLRLCRRRRSGTELVLWTVLKFTTMEDLVLFHNMFVALRSQDEGHPPRQILDHELQDEDEIFGGKINDDEYPHALRVYQDLETGAVRLQSSIMEGEMSRTPVWTAFITKHVEKPRLIQQYDATTIHIRNLKPVIFISAEDYSPPKTKHGDHVLKFTSASDAEGFLNIMHDLYRSYTKRR
ncbi:hypothetical protein PENARI_c032G00671 [Penicillium arizonense]|uniref:Uncharacterized protein n=1 Tax=Penicillium arizonense TaxID=1835702 RepID=A0A1F5L4J9_PENAI|nr:hypothetical protein PENARI_c032G00671 [Penicillium arizonense]OGE48122.1 hypothetical protein PENARI_c032G00671 [Penicillium arizonense]